MLITFITVKTKFEGVHCYPNAPEEVAYLRNPHRHEFHVEAEIEVFHDDRELEFIMVKHRIDEFFEIHSELGSMSCEMIAMELRNHLWKLYPLPKGEDTFSGTRGRKINIRVSEDGENGVYLKEV